MTVLVDVLLSLMTAGGPNKPPKNNLEAIEQLSKHPTVNNILTFKGSPQRMSGNDREEIWTYIDKSTQKNRWVFHIDSENKIATKIEYFPTDGDASVINTQSLTTSWKNCKSEDAQTYKCDKNKEFVSASNQVTFLSVGIP